MSKKIMKTYDGIVIGAGPAGSEIAYRLAKAGFEIIMLEKERLDREKTCGGGLQIQEIAEFGLPPATVIERKIHNVRLIKGVEKPSVLAGYKYFLAIKWPVFHVLFGSSSRRWGGREKVDTFLRSDL